MTFRTLFRPAWGLACVISVLVGTGRGAATGRAGLSSAYLVVDSLLGAAGSSPTDFGATLASDVASPADGATVSVADIGRATFSLAMKDPAATAPSAVNAVTLSSYHVAFSRTDGRNVPGVDVPFSFTGALTLTVRGTVTSAPFVLVRAQAKREAPLAALAGGGGAVAISAIAEVTFYGRDQAGRDVSVAARIGITFSDWLERP